VDDRYRRHLCSRGIAQQQQQQQQQPPRYGGNRFLRSRVGGGAGARCINRDRGGGSGYDSACPLYDTTPLLLLLLLLLLPRRSE